MCLSIVVLNINDLSSPITLADWIKKQDLIICCLQEIQFTGKKCATESGKIESNIPCKWNPKTRSSYAHMKKGRLLQS